MLTPMLTPISTPTSPSILTKSLQTSKTLSRQTLKLKLEMDTQLPGRFASRSRRGSGRSIKIQSLREDAAHERTLNNEVTFYS